MNQPTLAPTSAPVNSSGGKNAGKAEEAATAMGTVASPIGVWSMPKRACFRRTVNKPSRVNGAQRPLAQVGGEDVSCQASCGERK